MGISGHRTIVVHDVRHTFVVLLETKSCLDDIQRCDKRDRVRIIDNGLERTDVVKIFNSREDGATSRTRKAIANQKHDPATA